MTTVTNYVDVSAKSLAIAGLVFIIAVFVTKYLLDSYSYSAEVKEEDKRSIYLTMLYCVIVGFVFAGLTLVLCKQFCKFGTCDILTDPFPTGGR